MRKAGLKGDVFETLRTEERQEYLIKNGKSWTKHSEHIVGAAFDLVLAEKWQARVLRYIWSVREEYEEVNDAAIDIGLFSMGEAYKKDLYHYELPRIVQDAGNCFAFAVINCLAFHSPIFRVIPKEERFYMAKRIEIEMTGKSVIYALKAAVKLGYINKYTRISKENREDRSWWNNQKGPIVISQKRILGIVKTGRWREILKRVKLGQGITGHAVAFMYSDQEGLNLLNSHYTIPEYVLSDLGQIQGAYKITI